MIGLDYTDEIQLVKPVIDKYATPKIGQVETVSALFIQRTGYSHANNQSAIDSDAELYIDPEHWFVVENAYRLEELLVIANPFGAESDESWYKIINVVVAQDKLLTNQIDNIRLDLKKTMSIDYVS